MMRRKGNAGLPGHGGIPGKRGKTGPRGVAGAPGNDVDYCPCPPRTMLTAHRVVLFGAIIFCSVGNDGSQRQRRGSI